jgi:cellulose synthase/poly-beta-1,6-N-acetylglucosamine synthase-like glycosyltransferase
MAVAATTLAWMLHAWRTPASLARTHFDSDGGHPQHSFSLIVPARHEEAVLEQTLTRLCEMDHPDFEVVVVTGDDDPATRAVAEEVAERYPDRVHVVEDTSPSKNKPRALNTALPLCTGEITGVFDAEDDVHPRLLAHIDECLMQTDADVVQSGVQLMNFDSSWFSVRNVLEYYFWFRSRLHFHAERRFIPLGGNTVFIRTDLLRDVGGWDPACLAEDCELGVRLSARRANIVVAYEPALVTREETPHTLRALARQRTRWNQGYLQTLRRGEWRKLPPGERALAVYTLSMPFIQAFAGVMIPVSIATILLAKVPVGLALASFLPLIPTVTLVAVEIVGLGDFCRQYGLRPRLRDYARLVLGTLPYQWVLALAAVRAALRELFGVRDWKKTSHKGAHLATDVRLEQNLPAEAPRASA